MFKFFWLSYRKNELFSCFNSYNNFKNIKSKKIFVISEDAQKNFYNFKKYDMNLKNNVSSRDIVIQYLFDSKFSVFLVFIKVIVHLLIICYMLLFLLRLLVTSLLVVKLFIVLLLNIFFYILFIFFFIVNLLASFLVSAAFLFVKSKIFMVLSLTLLLIKSTPLFLLALVSFAVLHMLPASIIITLFVFFKFLLFYIHAYLLFSMYAPMFAGFKFNENFTACFVNLSKKINFFLYILVSQSAHCFINLRQFLYFSKTIFYFLFSYFKLLFYSNVSLIFKKNIKPTVTQKLKAVANFFNFVSIDDSKVVETSLLLKLNYRLMQNLKFQKMQWLVSNNNYYTARAQSISLLSIDTKAPFFLKKAEMLLQPETVLYWKNFNKNSFTKPSLSAFLADDMSKNNANAFVRNTNQVSSSSNLQYSNSPFKKIFQYGDISNFYLQNNKNNTLTDNSLFSYNYKNGLSRKWNQSRYLSLLSDNSYSIIKNLHCPSSQITSKSAISLKLTLIT